MHAWLLVGESRVVMPLRFLTHKQKKQKKNAEMNGKTLLFVLQGCEEIQLFSFT